MSDVKLSRFESFPKHSFAPGLWVEFEGVQLIAVPDKGPDSCIDCHFYVANPAHRKANVMPCAIQPPSGNKAYACGTRNAGKKFGHVTVRFFDEPTYAKMRTKGEL